MTFAHIRKLGCWLRFRFNGQVSCPPEKPIKDAALSFRITTDLKEWIDIEAERLGMSTGGMIELLLKQYAQQRTQHGSALLWPPEFIRHTHPATNQPESPKPAPNQHPKT